MNEFKVGDKVRIKHRDINQPQGWTSEMDKTVGMTGIIALILDKGYKIEFSDGYGFWKYSEKCLELVEESNKFKIGDKVKIKYKDSEDRYWMPNLDKTVKATGRIINRSRLTVGIWYEDRFEVSFEEETIANWSYRAECLEFVEETYGFTEIELVNEQCPAFAEDIIITRSRQFIEIEE